jgi:hypothetical protein
MNPNLASNVALVLFATAYALWTAAYFLGVRHIFEVRPTATDYPVVNIGIRILGIVIDITSLSVLIQIKPFAEDLYFGIPATLILWSAIGAVSIADTLYVMLRPELRPEFTLVWFKAARHIYTFGTFVILGIAAGVILLS